MSKINILKRLQNKAVRSIFCAKYTCHTDPLYKLSGIVKVINICKVELLFTMYQYKYGNLPKPLLELIQNSLIPNNEQTRSAGLKIHGKHKKGTLLFDLINTWNECDDVYIKNRKYSAKSVKGRIRKYYQTKSSTNCTSKSCISCKATEFKKYEKLI